MRQRRVAITGAAGQLGRALIDAFGHVWTIDPLARPECDLRDWRSTRDRLASFQPDLVIHTAAATDVDGCELDPVMAFTVNALGTRHLARAAAAIEAEFVYISTNYVYDGSKADPYHEFDAVGPISVYGFSKLAGECETFAASPRCYVIRTAWLYAAVGRNFVNTMRQLLGEREQLRIVSDQYGNPTFAADLAVAIGAVTEGCPYGVYNITNTGHATWYQWATEIAAIVGATTDIEPIPAVDWARPATPPVNGVMTSIALPSLEIVLPDWREALRRCINA